MPLASPLAMRPGEGKWGLQAPVRALTWLPSLGAKPLCAQSEGFVLSSPGQVPDPSHMPGSSLVPESLSLEDGLLPVLARETPEPVPFDEEHSASQKQEPGLL